MTSEAQLAPAQAGELRADGTFVVKREERPNGWAETHRVGKLKIRGEREPRTINYNDYAKLLTFYNAQERLIKDRKHIMVALSDGLVVNTADITSLEQAEEDHFTPKEAQVDDKIRELPTQELLLDLDGNTLATSAKTWREIDAKTGDKFRVAHCHYLEREDGSRDYLTSLDMIPDAMEYRKSDEPGYAPTIVQRYKYGIPQL
jgi:hypothetical protein